MVIVAQDGRGDRTPWVADALAGVLSQLGVRAAYGVCGREIVPMWVALGRTLGTEREIATLHTRHENGAGYAAFGEWATTGRPAVAFVTAGPGLTNVITSLQTARAAGAKLVLLSPLTPAANRGRLGIQDTSARGFRSPELYQQGGLFDLVASLETPHELQTVVGQLAMGLAGEGAFMAHLALSTELQVMPLADQPVVPAQRRPSPGVPGWLADEAVDALSSGRFVVCVGWGARRDRALIRRFLDLTGAPAVSSPRGLGILEGHHTYLGGIGNGGRASVLEAVKAYAPEHILILGSGYGEATSGWADELTPRESFIHVDLDDRVFARAYPTPRTLGIQASVAEFLRAVLARNERLVLRPALARRCMPARLKLVPVDGDEAVHPGALMAAIQRQVIDATDMVVIADAASSMFWGARFLAFDTPGRWVTENRFGAMGFASAAVVGAARAAGGPALAIVGDGAMHMQDEINTAVRYGVPAIWVVLNDSGLGIVRAGMTADGMLPHDADFPETDFAAVARAKGAAGIRVTREQDLDAALEQAIALGSPCVVDVVLDQFACPPIGARTRCRPDAAA